MNTLWRTNSPEVIHWKLNGNYEPDCCESYVTNIQKVFCRLRKKEQMTLSLIIEVLRSGYSFGVAPQEELHWQHGQCSRKAGVNHMSRAALPERIRISSREKNPKQKPKPKPRHPPTPYLQPPAHSPHSSLLYFSETGLSSSRPLARDRCRAWPEDAM